MEMSRYFAISIRTVYSFARFTFWKDSLFLLLDKQTHWTFFVSRKCLWQCWGKFSSKWNGKFRANHHYLLQRYFITNVIRHFVGTSFFECWTRKFHLVVRPVTLQEKLAGDQISGNLEKLNREARKFYVMRNGNLGDHATQSAFRILSSCSFSLAVHDCDTIKQFIFLLKVRALKYWVVAQLNSRKALRSLTKKRHSPYIAWR